MEYNYKDIFQSLHDGVYFVDRNRRITYWNPAAERITGFLAGEVIGSRCMDNVLIHIDEAGRSLCKGFCHVTPDSPDPYISTMFEVFPSGCCHSLQV